MIIHKSDSRGYNKINWLETYHSFSFADYYNPDKMNFGALRVLNDDIILPEKGFDMHSHHDMEIVTIPLEGAVLHKDNLGHSEIIKPGEIQVMSAGTGIRHAEFNASETALLKLLQIWIIPDQKNVSPRYEQATYDDSKMYNDFYPIVSPWNDPTGLLKIHQKAWLHLSKFEKGNYTYHLKDPLQNVVYFFLIEGNLYIRNELLNKRDAIGIVEDQDIIIRVPSSAFLLTIEVPLF